MKPLFHQFLILATFAPLAFGCAESVDTNVEAAPSALGTCGQNLANIAIGDGYFQTICGCLEGNDGAVVREGSLTCTIRKGSVVNFQFPGALLSHQVLSTGTPSFVSSDIIKQDEDLGIQIPPPYAVQFSQTGTYSFEDPFLPGISGQIVVQ